MIRKRKINRGNKNGLKIRRRADDSEGAEEAKEDTAAPQLSPSSSADEADDGQQILANSAEGEQQKELKDEEEEERTEQHSVALSFDEKGEVSATMVKERIQEVVHVLANFKVRAESGRKRKIEIFDFGSSNFTVFDGVDLLLRQFRLLCHSVHRPKNELVTELPNVPAVLLPEQTQVLLENGFAKLRRIRNTGGRADGEQRESDEQAEIEPISSPHLPQSVAYAVKLTVFRDLWRKGFYLADGAKFGCDYLAYRRPPPEQHSEFMVICTDANANDGVPPLRPLNLIGVSRASTQVRKRILLAIVSVGSPVPYYLEMNWWKGDDE
ncbi:hypothetical protein niasHT_019527 [Heterodera trifolii]|uniref:tRNA-intron lyase n=1 Tax=Heterodera trifolii TaxID=157864 RepID=A0ABD2KW08_9BILA